MTVNAGDIPTADDFNKVRVVVKSAGQIINNSQTLTNDSELLVSVDASATYAFHLYLISTSGTTPDIKFGFAFPTGATCTWGAIRMVTGATLTGDADFGAYSAATSGSSSINAAGTGAPQLTVIGGSLVVGATAGTLQLMWAQATQTASDTTLHAGSSLVITQA